MPDHKYQPGCTNCQHRDPGNFSDYDLVAGCMAFVVPKLRNSNPAVAKPINSDLCIKHLQKRKTHLMHRRPTPGCGHLNQCKFIAVASSAARITAPFFNSVAAGVVISHLRLLSNVPCNAASVLNSLRGDLAVKSDGARMAEAATISPA